MSEIRFDGRTILVTGGGHGMGRAHALLLASRGAKVVIAGRTAEPIEFVANEVNDQGGEAVAFPCDLTKEVDAARAVEACVNVFGRIDALIHNAGIAPVPQFVGDLPSKDIDDVMHLGAVAPLWLARAAWPHMVKQRSGRIVLISSHSILGAEKVAAYAASKSAMIGCGRSIAMDGGPFNIFTNMVAVTAWSRILEGLWGEDEGTKWFKTHFRADAVSPAIAFLCSDECGINGELFSVGGGRISRIVFAETEGVILEENSIEAVADHLPQLLEKDVKPAQDMFERRTRINRQLGYTGTAF